VTVDEACLTAARLLEERGQLMNGHLLRLVDGDKSLFREVRDALIRTGKAEDRSGVGLVKSDHGQAVSNDEIDSITTTQSIDRMVDGQSQSGEPTSATIIKSDPSAADWWLMTSGVIKGPFELHALRQMQKNDEIGPGDVVRRGSSGLWCQPDDVLVPPAKENRNVLQIDGKSGSLPSEEGGEAKGTIVESTELPAPYVPPPKVWTADARPSPSWLSSGWMSVADLVGGTRRMWQLLIVMAVVGAAYFWWLQPPPVGTIYTEFADCSRALQKLRERRVGRSEWAPTVNRVRPRIQGLVDRLQYRSHPAQKELYFAGKLGLLPLLDIPANPTDSERIFDKHMNAVRLLLEGDSSEKTAVSTSKIKK
jgi:hypothetical protein